MSTRSHFQPRIHSLWRRASAFEKADDNRKKADDNRHGRLADGPKGTVLAGDVEEGSQAYEQGVSAGSRLLMVNQTSVDGMDAAKAKWLIQAAGRSVQLVMVVHI